MFPAPWVCVLAWEYAPVVWGLAYPQRVKLNFLCASRANLVWDRSNLNYGPVSPILLVVTWNELLLGCSEWIAVKPIRAKYRAPLLCWPGLA